MYQDTKTREYTKPDLQAQMREGEVEWSGKWRNLYFTKDGGSWVGESIHQSRRAALVAAKKWLADALTPGKYDVAEAPGIGLIPISLVSRTVIQLPVKE